MKALHGIDHCWDDDCDCERDRRHPNVLVIDRSSQTLGLSLYKRYQGMLVTKIAHQDYYFYPYGHNEILQSDNEPNFEQVLRRFLTSIDGPADRVVLTGNGATDARFWSVLRTVFEGDGVLNGHSYHEMRRFTPLPPRDRRLDNRAWETWVLSLHVRCQSGASTAGMVLCGWRYTRELTSGCMRERANYETRKRVSWFSQIQKKATVL